ncbi:MAG: hypothetical protein H0U76_30935, partial [Ktedonobacteraceae bacterium]|nr:hypothetical protein [Ktedonobacteraceae bacterium]
RVATTLVVVVVEVYTIDTGFSGGKRQPQGSSLTRTGISVAKELSLHCPDPPPENPRPEPTPEEWDDQYADDPRR